MIPSRTREEPCFWSWSLVSALFALAWPTSGTVAATIAAKVNAKPALQITWLPTCAANGDEALFSVDVFDDGRVRYLGNEEMKEQGERVWQVPPDNVQQLLTASKTYPWSTGASASASESIYVATYCISMVRDGVSVQIGDGANNYVPRTFHETMRELRSLDAVADKALGIKQRTCPTRAQVFVGTRFCGELLLALGFEERHPCGYWHTVMINQTGALLYFVDGYAGSDRRMQLNPEQFGNVIEMLRVAVKRLGGSEMQIDTFDASVPADPPNAPPVVTPDALRRLYHSPDKVVYFRDELARIAGIRWQSIDQPEKVCSPKRDRYPFPQGWVDIHLPFADQRR